VTAVLDLPTAELLGVFEPGSPEWHAAREDGVGGSEIAALLGISPWESAFSLWHRKRKLASARMANTEMDAGRRLEPVIAEVFQERHPEFELRTAGTYRNRERRYQIANPDRLIYPARRRPGADCSQPCGVFEAKFALSAADWGEELTAQAPLHYLAQTRWYLDALGLSVCHLMVFIGGTGEFREFVIKNDAEDRVTMRTAAEEFMQRVANNIRPKIDGHEATLRTVKALPDGMVDLDVEIWPLLRDQYFDALDAYKAAEFEKNRAAALVLDQIGDGHRAVCRRERVATRTVRDGKTYSLQPARNRERAA
jgi:putative phage-type endonuclease